MRFVISLFFILLLMLVGQLEMKIGLGWLIVVQIPMSIGLTMALYQDIKELKRK